MSEQKSEYGIEEFKKNAHDICGLVCEGGLISLTKSDKIIADMRSIEDGGLPEDGNYMFVSLSDAKTAGGLKVIQDHFAKGQAVIIKDYPTKSIAITGRPNKNIVVMTPALS